MSDRNKIFISYSHDDARWRKQLVSHLAVLAMDGILDPWDDRVLDAGDADGRWIPRARAHRIRRPTDFPQPRVLT